MPPKVRITKEQLISAGLDIVRIGGPEALNARAVAARLGCSTQPVFSNYAAMEDLQRDVLAAAEGLFRESLGQAMDRADIPPYKAMGMGYIAFARREPALYRWLFMRDRTGEALPNDRVENAAVIDLIAEQTGMDRETAWLFHVEMWVFVHGLGAMVATGYLDWNEELVSGMLTDLFQGLRARFREKEGGHV